MSFGFSVGEVILISHLSYVFTILWRMKMGRLLLRSLGMPFSACVAP